MQEKGAVHQADDHPQGADRADVALKALRFQLQHGRKD
jgi:hypothetical protein